VRGGKLGYNVKLILEMGEETGSPGLNAVCQQYAERLKADLFIASDGPRVNAPTPTMFLGSRGGCSFDLKCTPARWRPSLRQLGRACCAIPACAWPMRSPAWSMNAAAIRVPALLPESAAAQRAQSPGRREAGWRTDRPRDRRGLG
jgi:hypothetical protein